MSESRLVPCNLLAWPGIKDLLPDQKLIVYHCWATCPAACGCFLVDFGGWHGQLSIAAAALEEAVREFERRGLVAMDWATGEMFILDWFRWHKFDNPKRARLFDDSVKRVQSESLKKQILEKSIGCILREGKGREGNKPPPPNPSGAGGEGGGGGGNTNQKPEHPTPPAGAAAPLAPVGAPDDIDDLVQAAEWLEKTAGKAIKTPAAWRAHVRERMVKHGPTPDDHETLRTWRKHLEKQVQSAAAAIKAAEEAKNKPHVDPEALERCREEIRKLACKGRRAGDDAIL